MIALCCRGGGFGTDGTIITPLAITDAGVSGNNRLLALYVSNFALQSSSDPYSTTLWVVYYYET